MSEPSTAIFKVQSVVPDAHPDAPCLTVLAGTQAGRVFLLTADGETIIGRADDAGIVLDDEGVSRQHCKVRLRDGSLDVWDLGSTNGTYCHGVKIDAATLHPGDRIQMGPTAVVQFAHHDGVERGFFQQLYDAASLDGLTKIANRRTFLDRLRHELAYCQRHALVMSVAMIDVDFFKTINDRYGHVSGDAVLTQLAALMVTTVRTEDLVARYGGEEFAVILRGIDETQGRLFGERLRRVVETTRFAVPEVTLTISVGLATWRRANPQTPEALVAAADEHLYRAKQAGRNCVRGNNE